MSDLVTVETLPTPYLKDDDYRGEKFAFDVARCEAAMADALTLRLRTVHELGYPSAVVRTDGAVTMVIDDAEAWNEDVAEGGRGLAEWLATSDGAEWWSAVTAEVLGDVENRAPGYEDYEG